MKPEDVIAQLTRRIWLLEQEVAELKRLEGLPERKPEPAAGTRPPPPAPRRPERPAPDAATPHVRRADAVTEANVVGTWFARTGMVAILIGAGFAFKYAVDRGFIGPQARVAIGLVAGLAFIAWGEIAIRRGWDLFAQAVSGGGIALWYLSVLSALHLFDLIGVPVAFVALVAITAAAATLALRHDSEALAALAMVGGFLNPFLVGADRLDPLAFLGYIAALDVLILAVAPKRWAALDRIALIGTVAVVLAVTPQESFVQRVAFATVLFAIFVAVPFMRALLSRDADAEEPAAPQESDVLVGTAAAYTGYMLWVLSTNHSGWRGVFMLALAGFYVCWAILSSRLDLRVDAASMAGVALVLTAIFVPVQYRGVQVAAGWAAEGLVLSVVHARGYASGRLRVPAEVLLGLGAATIVLALAESYPPRELVLNGPALCTLIVVACISAAAVVAGRDRSESSAPVTPPFFWPVVANVVAVIWMSQELAAELSRRFADPEQAVQFGLTALWAVYAAVLLAVGVAIKTRWVRLAGVAGFAITIGKLVVVDLWLLRTPYRIVVFLGLGVILLASSVMYQRFRDFVLAEEDEPQPPEPEAPAVVEEPVTTPKRPSRKPTARKPAPRKPRGKS